MGLDNKILSIKPKDFKALLKYGSRYKGTDIKPLIYFPYIFVKSELPTYLTQGNFEAVFKALGVSTVINLPDAMPIVLWCYDELKTIAQMETDYVSTPPKPEMVSAGIDTLNELGAYNVIDMLVKDWCGAYTHEEIEQMPYHKIFDKQRKMKLEGDIQEKLMQIQKEKSKRKF